MSARLPGFTLIEVLAVVLLTAAVLGVSLNYYVNLSRVSQRATDHTRDIRRAASVLDRISRDLESTILVRKPAEMDPNLHPWLFLGESRHMSGGSDQLKFVTRSHEPRGDAAHESDLAMVAYTLRRGEEGDFELMRWSSPHLPEDLDRTLPREESDGAVLIAGGIETFRIHFLDDFGDVTNEWDSSTLVDSSELPIAVEVELAFIGAEDWGEDLDEARTYRRTTVLAVRPYDLEELLNPASPVSGGGGDEVAGNDEEDADGEGGCRSLPCANMTACQAIDCQGKIGAYGPSTDALLERMIASGDSFCTFWRLSAAFRWMIQNPQCR